jgi:predicted Zn-dependent peptidase
LNAHTATTENAYRKTTLPNGIRIVTEDIPYVRSISFGVWVDTGSRDETEANNGISHFIEHMVFKGTKRFGMQGIAQSLESCGGYLNAFTTKEHTCYYARVLDQDLPKAIDVISDMIQFPLFPEKEIEKEKQVVIEEIKNIEDDPDDLIHDWFDRVLYGSHSLAYPVIGTPENIRAFTRQTLRAHMESHYTSNRIIVVAAGRLQHEHVVKLVEKYFGKIRPGKDRPSLSGPKRIPKQKRVFDKPINQAHVCVGTLGFSVKSRQRYPLLVLNTILGDGMSSRLFQNIREKYGFAYAVYSFANMMSDAGNFGVYVGTDKANIDNSIGLIMRELEKLVEKPVTKKEFARAKAQVKGSMMMSLESTSSRMMRLGNGELFYGRYSPIDEILKKMDAITIDEVQAVAKNLLIPERFSTVIFQPDGKAAVN